MPGRRVYADSACFAADSACASARNCLWAVLEETLPPGATGLLAALSGGPDSSCLLAVACAGPAAQAGAYAALERALPLRAVHVDHGLQAVSSAMRDAGAALCRRFGVPLEVVRVEVDTEGGVSDRGRGSRGALSRLCGRAQAGGMSFDGASRARSGRDLAAAAVAGCRAQGLVGDARAPALRARLASASVARRRAGRLAPARQGRSRSRRSMTR